MQWKIADQHWKYKKHYKTIDHNLLAPISSCWEYNTTFMYSKQFHTSCYCIKCGRSAINLTQKCYNCACCLHNSSLAIMLLCWSSEHPVITEQELSWWLIIYRCSLFLRMKTVTNGGKTRFRQGYNVTFNLCLMRL